MKGLLGLVVNPVVGLFHLLYWFVICLKWVGMAIIAGPSVIAFNAKQCSNCQCHGEECFHKLCDLGVALVMLCPPLLALVWFTQFGWENMATKISVFAVAANFFSLVYEVGRRKLKKKNVEQPGQKENRPVAAKPVEPAKPVEIANPPLEPIKPPDWVESSNEFDKFYGEIRAMDNVGDEDAKRLCKAAIGAMKDGKLTAGDTEKLITMINNARIETARQERPPF